MKKHTSIRFPEKILALLNDDAIKADIKLSEQVRAIVAKHYENSGLSIGEVVMKAAKKVHKRELSNKSKKTSHKKKVVPQNAAEQPEVVPQPRKLIIRDKPDESPDDLILVNNKWTVRKNAKP